MIDETLKNANILLIDDQQVNIDVLTGLLDLEGYTNYRSTTDPREVVSLFTEFKPDILLLDLSMPHLNGFQVMKQLSSRIPENTFFPILILTADISAESKLIALAAGAADFITKPFDLIEVDLRIKNLLKTRYLYQQLENQNQILEEKVKLSTKELVIQDDEKEKRAAELIIANKELVIQDDEKEKRAAELIIANKELVFQKDEKEKRAAELIIANKELVFQSDEKEKRAAELIIADKELVFQSDEKEKRAAELIIADKELVFQSDEKEKRAAELIVANKELLFQNNEKEKRAAELIIANKELIFQNKEKEKRAAELLIANEELLFQNNEKEKRAAELIIADKELVFQSDEKEKRAAELRIANKELLFQNNEKEKRAAELIIANKELLFQNGEKEMRAAELIVANKELVFQNQEKEKRAAELNIANKELIFQNNEKEIRAAELVIAKDRAEEMNRLKSNFLANMSHELRTPLIGINGFADFLRQDIKEPELKEMAEIIFNSGNRLSETLNLILDLSKFESETMDFNYQKFDVVKETTDIINLFKGAARKKGLSIKAVYSQPAIIIDTDGWAFRSILNNLINNAIKYTNHGEVVVYVSLIAGYVQVKVSDTGIGITKAYYDIIFEEFRQVSEGLSRNFEGTGLGLNITKKIVEKFEGKISVESEVGKGSIFTVQLPILHKESIAEGNSVIEKEIPPVAPLQPLVRRVALLVDDDPNVFPILKRYIANKVDLESIMDGEAAIELCSEKHFNIIFMDINLRRGIDGKQVTQTIRKLKGYGSIPIVATTAYAMVGDKEEFFAAGCTHYLSKPFKQQEVEKLINELLSV